MQKDTSRLTPARQASAISVAPLTEVQSVDQPSRPSDHMGSVSTPQPAQSLDCLAGSEPVDRHMRLGLNRAARRAKPGSAIASRPSIRIVPASGRSSPTIWFTSVVLPAPLWPSRPYTWPASTVRLTAVVGWRAAPAVSLVDPLDLEPHCSSPFRWPPSLGSDTSQYVDTYQYVNTLEYRRTDWYHQAMQERLNRQERKSQTRERLIDAAAAVFARRGFETATIDEVAAAAGYTKGAVYSNFASKTDLFIALIERRIEVQTADHARHFEGQDLTTVTRGLQDEPERESESDRQWLLLAVEFWLHAMRDERARTLMAEQYERARLASARLIEPFYEMASQQPPFTPREMAIVIEAIGAGLAFQAALDPAAVRMSLQGEVTAMLLNLPKPQSADSSTPQPAATATVAATEAPGRTGD